MHVRMCIDILAFAWLLITRDTNSVTAVFGLVVIAHMPFSTACMLE